MVANDDVSPSPQRQCRSCSRLFVPSSRHLDCPSCRSRDSCGCGASKQRSSTVCSGCRPNKGRHNGNWRGGVTYHKKGYLMRRVPDHPRARSSPYVFEHILVMEARLGRYLTAEENVHHLNGVKDDNRIENLELWTKPHPSGIRVEDAVAWAKEILNKYDHPSQS